MIHIPLDRCPFCGCREAEIIYCPPFIHPKNGRKGIERWQAGCKNCGVVTAAFLTEEDAARAWNRRAL